MTNISLKGENIHLERGKFYIVIDALYLTDIMENVNKIDKSGNIEQEVKEKIFLFPNTETPFASIRVPPGLDNVLLFGINKIKKEKGNENISNLFSSDTGLIVFIERSILIDFSTYFDYNKLVESITGPININYWTEIEQKFGPLNCALILSPGINKGFDFDGSGLYKIEI